MTTPSPLLDRLVVRAHSAAAAGLQELTPLLDDLEALLNTRVARRALFLDRRILDGSVDRIRHSVLNYGTPDLADPELTSAPVEIACDEIEKILAWFEPRLRQVKVRPLGGSGGTRTLHLHLSATVVGSSTPLSLSIDVETNKPYRVASS